MDFINLNASCLVHLLLLVMHLVNSQLIGSENNIVITDFTSTIQPLNLDCNFGIMDQSSEQCQGQSADDFLMNIAKIELNLRTNLTYSIVDGLTVFEKKVCPYVNMQEMVKMKRCLMDRNCWSWKKMLADKSSYVKNHEVAKHWKTNNFLTLYVILKYDLCTYINSGLRKAYYDTRFCSSHGVTARKAPELFTKYRSCMREPNDHELFKMAKKYILRDECNSTAGFVSEACNVETYLRGRDCEEQFESFKNYMIASSTASQKGFEISDIDSIRVMALEQDGIKMITKKKCDEELARMEYENRAGDKGLAATFLITFSSILICLFV